MAQHPAIVWQSPLQTPLLRRLARVASLAVGAVGSPDATKAAQIAAEWGSDTTALTDLRAAIATAQRGTLILLADPGWYGAPGPAAERSPTRLDVEELDAAEERGVKVVSLEPIPAGLNQLAEAGIREPVVLASPAPQAASPEWVTLAPLSRFARPLQELTELLPTLGPARQLTLHLAGTPAHGSLGARLFDAADLATLLLGPHQPESVHAVFTAPAAGRGLHQGPPPAEHVRGLDGDLAATLRFAGNTAAAMTITNRAGAYDLALTLLTAEATATIRGGRLTLHHHGDALAPVTPAVRPDEDPFIQTLSAQITRYLESGVGLAGRVDFTATLALCQAALLSARTGEPESPATLRLLAGG